MQEYLVPLPRSVLELVVRSASEAQRPFTEEEAVVMLILDAVDGRSRAKAEYARLWRWGEEGGRSRVRRAWDQLVFSAMQSLTWGGRRKLKAGDVPGAWWPVWKRMAKHAPEPEPERPPDRETAVQYFAARGMGRLGERFYDYYASRGWRTKSGERITSWRSAAANWIRDQPRFEGRRSTNGHAKKNGQTYTYAEAVRIWQKEGGSGKFPGGLFEKVEGEPGGKPRYRRK